MYSADTSSSRSSRLRRPNASPCAISPTAIAPTSASAFPPNASATARSGSTSGFADELEDGDGDDGDDGAPDGDAGFASLPLPPAAATASMRLGSAVFPPAKVPSTASSSSSDEAKR